MADIRDVAKAAQCSTATVSRAFNAPHLVRPETVARVQAAAIALKFRPNALGRQLRGDRTGLIGVMLPTMANPVFADCIRGIEERLDEDGGRVVLITSRYDPKRERGAIEILLQQRVDGLLLTLADAERDPILTELSGESVPFVLLYNETPDHACVSVNNRLAAFDGVSMLTRAGHRRITMVSGNLQTSDRAKLRYSGYCDALNAAGLNIRPALEVDFNMTTLSADAVRQLTQGDAAPTAVFCSNDLLALAIMQALKDAGKRIPEDISVVGFDGLALGRLLSPALSTVCQPSAEMGRQGADRLLKKIAGQHDGGGVWALAHEVRQGGTVRSLN